MSPSETTEPIERRPTACKPTIRWVAYARHFRYFWLILQHRPFFLSH